MAFFSATLLGVEPLPVEIEIDLSPGLPFFQIVGLPDAILKESKTRVKSAILQSGFAFPADSRVVLNLAPSKVKKEGSGFELGLAARILSRDGQIAMPGLNINVLFLGELALDGAVRSVPEIEALSFATDPHFSQGRKIDLLVVPSEALSRLNHVQVPMVGIDHLHDFKGAQWWRNLASWEVQITTKKGSLRAFDSFSFTEFWAKHFLISVVGGHHYFLCGPPGCGKTFFAEGLHLLLTEFYGDEISVERKLLNAIFSRDTLQYPWAAPHHSASVAGLVGGGNPPRPGALTRAHGGILFLDELLEFAPGSLDCLREPLERGCVELYRAGNHLRFPSRFQLIGATNPCRCGHWRSALRQCTCPKHSRLIYQARMSGPFFDRFDVKLFCNTPLGNEALTSGSEIKRQLRKIKKFKEQIGEIEWSGEADKTLQRLSTHYRLNFRAREKVKRLSETLALITGLSAPEEIHIEEACQFQIFKGLESMC